MRYLKFIVPKQFIVLILSLYYLNSYGTARVIIKANILRGERFITAKTKTIEIENKVSEVLKKKGFDIVKNVESIDDILLVDFFVYQFMTQFPSVTITIRSKKGIHYIDRESRKIFVDRNLTNFNMATELAERVPAELNQEMMYQVNIGDLISPNETSNTFFYMGNSKYYSTVNWKENKISFIIPNDLRVYLYYASNFTGLKKHLSQGPILLKLRINNSARFELCLLYTSRCV